MSPFEVSLPSTASLNCQWFFNTLRDIHCNAESSDAASRKRERRLRSWLRHDCSSDARAEALHHSAGEVQSGEGCSGAKLRNALATWCREFQAKI